MVVSVIIVSYNVKYFLEQCLYSVEKALSSIAPEINATPAAEILVVDNNSPDDSLNYLRPRFPRVRFIANADNKGFGQANNQGLAGASGRYILFLNPDTILPEDYFSRTLAFMEATPDAGALGVRMIDGSGRFLKESRRGFPSLRVAFCKLVGLTALFPRSRWLAEYYLGHLPENSTHPAPVLSGACMLVRRDALKKTGGFDERFFMYAEDIDLSYRIEKAGYTNYYFAGTTILHFKGESTQKDARYVKLFYKAMSQFRHKHFTGIFATLFNGLVEAAIWVRAGIAAVLHWLRARPARKVSGEETAYRTWLAGDPVTTARLADRRPFTRERVLQSDPSRANEIIFCEGAAFSFGDCIEAFQHTPPQVIRKIHAASSLSAVGSYSKDGRGEVILL